MKKLLLPLSLILFAGICANSQQVLDSNVLLIHNITATVYNAVPSQCDEDYLHTADGSFIDKDDIENLNWIAISRDLEEKGIVMGDVVEIIHEDEDICGIYEVHDRMNSRWTNKIDFLVPDHIKLGKWENVTIKKYQQKR